jgi:hypothetical protein
MQPSKKIRAKVTWRDNNVTRRENVEFGLVAILVSLFLALRSPGAHYVLAAFLLTLVTIIVPRIFYPFALVWFGLSRVLGQVSSAVLMSLVFFVIVLPVGLVRKWRGIDPLKIKEFKRGRGSVLSPRNHVYIKEDLLKTF